jgi:putative Holliday junction resolvase
MALFNMQDLRGRIRPGQRLIGLDPGTKRVGVAISDALLLLASPRPALPRGKLAPMAEALRALALQEDAGGLVVGLPLSLDGSFGPAAQAAKDWAMALSEATGLPAALWDERLSSSAAGRLLIKDADLSRRRRAEVVDSVAAAWTLQAALDASA